MPRANAQQTSYVAARVTPELDQLIRRRADRRGVSYSEAVRELLAYGAFLDFAEYHGIQYTTTATALIGDGLGARLRHAAGVTQEKLHTLVTSGALTEDQAHAVADGAALVYAPEDLA